MEFSSCLLLLFESILNRLAQTLHHEVLDKCNEEMYNSSENIIRSVQAFQKATVYSTIEGHGRQGWLWLLAAVDLDKSNYNALYNLLENYRQLSHAISHVGCSHLASVNLAENQQDIYMAKADRQKCRAGFDKMKAYVQNSTSRINLFTSNVTSSFSTLVSIWSLAESASTIISTFNDELYSATILEYHKIKLRHPNLSSTDLNHYFFRHQMRHTGVSEHFPLVNIWEGFLGIAHFPDLIVTLRRAAVEFLLQHGLSEEESLRKASHPLVVWASVHTSDSVHQPHVTDDGFTFHSLF